MQIKACWAYKTKCCSGKKHINTHTSEAEPQPCKVWCWAQEPSVTNYNWVVTPVQQKARLLQESAQQWAAPSACAPLSSTSASSLSYLEAKKTSAFLLSLVSTATVVQTFVISRQDDCHRQDLELHVRMRHKFQAVNNVAAWLLHGFGHSQPIHPALTSFQFCIV